MADRELKVLKSRVKAAAHTCPDVEKVLKELFPEAFVPARVELKMQDVVFGPTNPATQQKVWLLSNNPDGTIHLSSLYQWSIEPETLMGGYRLVCHEKEK